MAPSAKSDIKKMNHEGQMMCDKQTGVYIYSYLFGSVIGREDFRVFDDCASSFRSIASIARILLSVFGSSREECLELA